MVVNIGRGFSRIFGDESARPLDAVATVDALAWLVQSAIVGPAPRVRQPSLRDSM